MRKRITVVVLTLIVLLALTACGKKSKDDILADLNDKVENMSAYKMEATLSVKTGAQAQSYDVEILYKNPSYYKVSLANKEKGQSQIIIRNDDGVFVLTPALNKTFKFQSDWPLNSSQVYLYESLVKDILLDEDVKFTAKDDTYVFEAKTNYQNSTLMPTQQIVFDKKELAPKSVKLLDVDKNALVEVKFTKVTFNSKIDKNAFDVKKNMTSAQEGNIPALAGDENPTLAVLYPSESSLPEGVTLENEKEITTENGTRAILTYGGEKAFTLIEEKAVVATSSAPIQTSGEPVDLGMAVGILSTHSVSWTADGVDYLLASEDLTQDELIEIASSVGETAEK